MKKGRVERESGVCVGEVRAGWGEIFKTCVKVFLIFFLILIVFG